MTQKTLSIRDTWRHATASLHAGELSDAQAALEDLEQLIAHQPEDERPCWEVQLLGARADLLWAVGDQQGELDHRSAAVERAASWAQHNPQATVHWAAALFKQAHSFGGLGHEQLQILSEAVQLAKQAPEPEGTEDEGPSAPALIADCFLLRARILLNLDQLDDAMVAACEALNAAETAPASHGAPLKTTLALANLLKLELQLRADREIDLQRARSLLIEAATSLDPSNWYASAAVAKAHLIVAHAMFLQADDVANALSILDHAVDLTSTLYRRAPNNDTLPLLCGTLRRRASLRRVADADADAYIDLTTTVWLWRNEVEAAALVSQWLGLAYAILARAEIFDEDARALDGLSDALEAADTGTFLADLLKDQDQEVVAMWHARVQQLRTVAACRVARALAQLGLPSDATAWLEQATILASDADREAIAEVSGDDELWTRAFELDRSRQPLNEDVLIAIRAQGTYYMSPDGETAITEPHHLTIESPLGDFRTHDCVCGNCLATCADTILSQRVSPESLSYLLRARGVNSTIRLSVAPDLQKPLASGVESSTTRAVAAFEDALQRAGTEVSAVAPLALGTWVRFCQDGLISADNVILEGMLGQVVEDPWDICTPGVSTMIRVVGAEEAYGHYCSWFEVVDEPDEEALNAADALWQEAPRIFQERHGWAGIVSVKKKRIMETRVRGEIAQLGKRIGDLAGKEDEQKQARGLARRLAQLMNGFAAHPAAAEALEIAARLPDAANDREELRSVIEDAMRWCEESAPPAEPE